MSISVQRAERPNFRGGGTWPSAMSRWRDAGERPRRRQTSSRVKRRPYRPSRAGECWLDIRSLHVVSRCDRPSRRRDANSFVVPIGKREGTIHFHLCSDRLFCLLYDFNRRPFCTLEILLDSDYRKYTVRRNKILSSIY